MDGGRDGVGGVPEESAGPGQEDKMGGLSSCQQEYDKTLSILIVRDEIPLASKSNLI